MINRWGKVVESQVVFSSRERFAPRLGCRYSTTPQRSLLLFCFITFIYLHAKRNCNVRFQKETSVFHGKTSVIFGRHVTFRAAGQVVEDPSHNSFEKNKMKNSFPLL